MDKLASFFGRGKAKVGGPARLTVADFEGDGVCWAGKFYGLVPMGEGDGCDGRSGDQGKQRVTSSIKRSKERLKGGDFNFGACKKTKVWIRVSLDGLICIDCKSGKTVVKSQIHRITAYHPDTDGKTFGVVTKGTGSKEAGADGTYNCIVLSSPDAQGFLAGLNKLFGIIFQQEEEAKQFTREQEQREKAEMAESARLAAEGAGGEQAGLPETNPFSNGDVWACNECAYTDNPACVNTCTMCEHPRGQAAEEDAPLPPGFTAPPVIFGMDESVGGEGAIVSEGVAFTHNPDMEPDYQNIPGREGASGDYQNIGGCFGEATEYADSEYQNLDVVNVTPAIVESSQAIPTRKVPVPSPAKKLAPPVAARRKSVSPVKKPFNPFAGGDDDDSDTDDAVDDADLAGLWG